MSDKIKHFIIKDMDLRDPRDLKPDPDNPRINVQAVDRLVEIIQIHGFQVPVDIDEKDNIICGHTRIKAALALGIGLVAVNVRKGWTEGQKKSFRIAHNRAGEFSFWDFPKLKNNLIEIKKIGGSLNGTGFDAFARKKIIDPPDPPKSKEVSFTAKTKTFKCPQCSHEWEA